MDLTEKQISHIDTIKTLVDLDMGDKGTCVLGYKMYVNGEQLCRQPWQGSLSCERFYKLVKEYLISEGVDPHNITIDYGKID